MPPHRAVLSVCLLAEFFLKEFYCGLRVCLTAALFHELSHKELQDGGLTCLVQFDLCGICLNDGFDHLEEGAFIGDLTETFFLDDIGRALSRIFCEHAFEDSFPDLTGNGALLDQAHQFCQVIGTDGAVCDTELLFAEDAEQFGEDPVCDSFGIFGLPGSGFEIFCESAVESHHMCIIFSQAIRFHIALAHCFGKFGQFCTDLFDILAAEFDGQKIGFGEIAVVVGVFFGTLNDGLTGYIVPTACILRDFLAGFERNDLAFDLIIDRPVGGAETVEVFDFDLGAELCLTSGADRHVHVAAHLSFFHIAVADIGIFHDLFERGEVSVCFIGGAHVRFRNDFHQWNAGPVVVQPGAVCKVGGFTGVFFQMDSGDTDIFIRQLFAGKSLAEDMEFAMFAQRLIILGDLIVFHQVRIEITFPVELAPVGDRAGTHQPCDDSFPDCFHIGNGERTGITHADGAGHRIRFAAECIRAVTEHFTFCPDLDMDFQSDDGFISDSHIRTSCCCFYKIKIFMS